MVRIYWKPGMPVMAYGADDWGSDDESIPDKEPMPWINVSITPHGLIIGIIIGYSICLYINCK